MTDTQAIALASAAAVIPVAYLVDHLRAAIRHRRRSRCRAS